MEGQRDGKLSARLACEVRGRKMSLGCGGRSSGSVLRALGSHRGPPGRFAMATCTCYRDARGETGGGAGPTGWEAVATVPVRDEGDPRHSDGSGLETSGQAQATLTGTKVPAGEQTGQYGK